MRSIKFLITLYICLTANFLFAQTTEEALHYLQDVTSSIEEFRTETWNVLRVTVQNKSSSELEWKIKALADKVESTRKEMVVEDGFFGDLSAKVSMTVFLKTAFNILTDDYKEIRRLEEKSQDSFFDMEKYLMSQNKANERLSAAGERLDDELKSFAKRYKIEVSEKKSPLSHKIEKASLALSYYNQVYLSYFKVYDQKLKVYDALKAEDMERITEEVSLLNDYSSESLGRLMILDGFMEDVSLNHAATDIISQFKYEAETVFPLALRAIEKKHIFHMAQGVFSSIPEAERTDKDIDHLNGLIDPLNNAIDKQNEEFTKSESKRDELFNNWNTQILAFFSTYLSS